MSSRLTYEKKDGTYGIKGYNMQNIPAELHKVVRKLCDYENIGPTPEQLQEIDRMYAELCAELAAVKKQSLPCKIGDTIYEVLGGQILPNKVIGFRIGRTQEDDEDNDDDYYSDTEWNIEFEGAGVTSSPISDIGKTLFLTPEDAKKALTKEAADEER